MDQITLDTWQGLSEYADRLDAAAAKLTAMFPNITNKVAWKETISSAQKEFRSTPNDSSDLRLEIAQHWLLLAGEGRLKVNMDRIHGLVVKEIDNSFQVTRPDLEKMLFKLINQMSPNVWLQLPEIQMTFSNLTGLSLGDHWNEFCDLINDLSEKRYIRCDGIRGRMPRYGKALNFDEWSEAMKTKPTAPTANTTFTFNGAVGAVQTGSNSVANVQQASGLSQYADLKNALQAALLEFANSDLPEAEREDAREYIVSTVQEIEKPKPNGALLKAILSGLSTTVQTLGASSDAYKAVTAALACLGFT